MQRWEGVGAFGVGILNPCFAEATQGKRIALARRCRAYPLRLCVKFFEDEDDSFAFGPLTMRCAPTMAQGFSWASMASRADASSSWIRRKGMRPQMTGTVSAA